MHPIFVGGSVTFRLAPLAQRPVEVTIRATHSPRSLSEERSPESKRPDPHTPFHVKHVSHIFRWLRDVSTRSARSTTGRGHDSADALTPVVERGAKHRFETPRPACAVSRETASHILRLRRDVSTRSARSTTGRGHDSPDALTPVVERGAERRVETPELRVHSFT